MATTTCRKGASGRADLRADYVSEIAALDELGEGPEAEAARDEVRARAAADGVVLVSIEITESPIPDPDIERLAPEDQARIERVTERMYQEPAALVGELERLVAQYPGLPILRNHLAGALAAAGQCERADRLVEETAAQFPEYLFGFANLLIVLVAQGGCRKPGRCSSPKRDPAE